MKALIEKLASGNSEYETPDAEISENRISVELEAGQTAQGEIKIKSKNNLKVKGVVFSTDSHVYFDNDSFEGVNCSVKYHADSKNLQEGQTCSGTISVVTRAGDYAIPFAISVKKKVIDTTIGEICDMNGFLKLVKESYDEALILFLSKEFRNYFLKDDTYASGLYTRVMKNANRGVAMEEFLVGMGLKDRIKIGLNTNIKEYTDVTENYGDVVNVTRSSWGYADIDVTVKGDFLYNCKNKISGDEFNGKIAEYQYYINASRLHGGSNHGRITFRTSNETLVYDIVIVNEKENVYGYIESEKSKINLVKNYLNFRTGVIDGRKWKDEMSLMAKERLKYNENDVMGLLALTQVAISDENEEAANSYLRKVSGVLSLQETRNVEEYCFYLYLRTLHKNTPGFTDEIKDEVKKYFEGGHDTWHLLWILFYMDERYDENPSLKYTMIKRMFNSGCNSPIMYYEAADVLNKQPELLRILNKFEVQVLNFAGKYHMVTDELAKQAAELFEKEKRFQQNYMDILSRLYEETRSEEVLSCICAMIINSNKTNHEYFHWLREGVRCDLKITNLYEYYIYTIDTTDYSPLEKSAYKYFSFGTDTLVYNRDYFYANMIMNFEPTDDIYVKCRQDMEKYATRELVRGNNNENLKIVYAAIVTDEFIISDMQDKMPEILHTYKIKVKNDDIRCVIVGHKEVETVQKVALSSNVAYAQLYTENPIITFMDDKGRVLAQTDYEITPMKFRDDITKVGSNAMTLLCQAEQIMKNPVIHQGEVTVLKEALQIPTLTEQYKYKLREFMVDYYYKGYDNGEMDIYILQFDMAQLSKKSRNKVMEILIQRNLTEMVYTYVVKYGYQSIRKDLLEKMCIAMVDMEEYDENKVLIEICAEAFRNGCRNDKVLTFLGKYYQSGSQELYALFLAMRSKHIQDNTLAERLLVQYIFESNTGDVLYDIYEAYLEGPTATTIRKGFYTYVTYNYFIKKVQCPDMVWDYLEQEYDNGLKTPVICSIAFIEALSKRSTLTERQIKITQSLMESLAKNNVNFEFYKKFNKWFKIPFNLVDKTIIDFRTNPKHKVNITYFIKTPEGNTKLVTEEMGSIYPGIFTKEVIMFYGEEIDYSITEYSDEDEHGKVVDNYSMRITEKNIYNDESRFGMINGMMICRSCGRDDAARELMQSYELCKESGKELFKLL